MTIKRKDRNLEKLKALLKLIAHICLMACMIGGVLWFIWPVVIPSIFPGLVETGILAGEIGLWPAICTGCFFSLLIKKSNINIGKKK